MSGATNAPTAVSEDTCQIPGAMRRLVIPRRGDVPSEPVAVDPKAAAYYAAWFDEQSPIVAGIVDHGHSEADLVEEYRASKGDLVIATPLAAAVAAAMTISQSTPAYENPAGIVDAWIATRGLAFAAAAAVELFGVKTSGRTSKGEQASAWLCRKDGAYEDIPHGIAVRVRQHLASAGEQDYAEVADVLARYRLSLASPTTSGQVLSRMLTSFLTPENVDWVESDFAFVSRAHYSAWLALASITTEEQVAALPAQKISAWGIARELSALWTALDNVGVHLLPVLTGWLAPESDPESVQRLLSIVAGIASADAFRYLVDNIDKKYFTVATQNAATTFPRRALQILGDAALRDTPRGLAAANVLRLHIVAHDELVQDELANLTPAVRDHVEKIRAANVPVPDAETDSLPTLFVSPPWLTAVKPARPVVITGLEAPTETVLAWRDGEKEQWASAELITNPQWKLESWKDIADRISTGGSAGWYANGHFAVEAPEDLVRSVLTSWEPDSWQSDTWIPTLVMRFGADALPPILSLARSVPASGAVFLAPFEAPEVALLAADWLSRLKTARPFALAWLTRHPGFAARTLIPAALGKAGKARSAAELTIRTLAARGFTAEITEAAAGYGDAVAQAVAAIVADDGTLTLPKTMPAVPDWAETRLLPQILLKGRQTALPEQSVKHLLLMLAVSKGTEPYAGIQMAKGICDPASLATFSWALFENWRGVDYPAKESWAFDALRWFGDDETVRRLSPMIRLWPGENGHQRAVAGLDVLADIGGTVALMHLYGISQKVKFKGLKEQATQRVTEIADDLGLTAEQLGDRLVPDLGLASSGTLSLDYGPRSFTVGFDEQLKPYVADQSGKRLKALPKPGAKDDQELAPAAHQQFSALKKDVRTLAASQIARFELAMVTQRRWTSQEFGEYFVGHPLLRHLVRRLVWVTFVDEKVGSAFRVAEDLSLADIADDEFTLADDAVIGVAHPLHIGGDVAAWSDVFADYEILQPFAQLGRTVFAFTDAEKASTRLTRFGGIETPVGKVLGLERRGWRRGAPQDAGIQGWISRALLGGGSVTATLDPGITVDYVAEWGETQRLQEVFISRHADGESYWNASAKFRELGSLDEITASELLRDLTEATTQ
ncbi:WGR domain-containing protein [Catenulispora acidiphila DSM 44928]|uniref:WGR domain-containing protein n=1 Tax=Catenulispora acidiphila (strain DSM 44928 / JCM 14897 / NBRC 102108 / NRRL B-24433 / ID139908) TaxID=479433 RepID=C7PVI5_CATAD|nr:DUF4132 domain-containing protein [Catenulispora acidiphila]ACU69341.1 WGR domain-containing protein [Catenulispora acidiphila DSM 44928]